MKIKIEGMEEKKKTDGNPFWLIRSGGKVLFCFDKKIAEYQVGDEIEGDIIEKEGTDFTGSPVIRYYLILSKEKKNIANISKVVSVNAMLLSYAKDLIITINQGKDKDLQQYLNEIAISFKFFKDLLGGDTNEK